MLIIKRPNTHTYFNIATEEYVLKNFEEDSFMLWRNESSVIVGKHQNTLAEINVEYVKRKKLSVVIRGLRMISDFEYEFQMALTNRKLSKEVETVFMMPSESYSYLSSKLIKEAASLGANLKGFVPVFVEKAIKSKLTS